MAAVVKVRLLYSTAWVSSVQLCVISAKLLSVQLGQHWTPPLTFPLKHIITHLCRAALCKECREEIESSLLLEIPLLYLFE